MSSPVEVLREEELPAPSAVDAPEGEPPLTVIERQPGWRLVNVRELWRYRELLFFLTWRDVKVRYKQTVLGAAWAVLQPLAQMAVFTLFLGRLDGVYSGAEPYYLFVFAGLLPWTFFAAGINNAGGSVVGSQNLITKVYFPRLLIPAGAVGAAVVDFAIALVMLLGLMLYNGVWPGWGVLLVPVVFLGLLVAALGVGTLLAALTVAYRDFRYMVPFLVQLWMFATPVIYMQAERVVGPRGLALLPLNPAYGLIANFRRVMFGEPPEWYSLLVSGAISVALLLAGCLYFRRVERSFADLI